MKLESISDCIILGEFDEKFELILVHHYKEAAFYAIKATTDLIGGKITWGCRRGLRVLEPDCFILDGFSQKKNEDEQKKSENDK